MKNKVKPVELTKSAIKYLSKIKTFNTPLFGENKAENIIDILFDRMNILENSTTDFSKIGAIDENFSHLNTEN